MTLFGTVFHIDTDAAEAGRIPVIDTCRKVVGQFRGQIGVAFRAEGRVVVSRYRAQIIELRGLYVVVVCRIQVNVVGQLNTQINIGRYVGKSTIQCRGHQGLTFVARKLRVQIILERSQPKSEVESLVRIAQPRAKAIVQQSVVGKQAQVFDQLIVQFGVGNPALILTARLTEIIKGFHEPFFGQGIGVQQTGLDFVIAVIVAVQLADLLGERSGIKKAIQRSKVFVQVVLVLIESSTQGKGASFFLETVSENHRAGQGPGIAVGVVVYRKAVVGFFQAIGEKLVLQTRCILIADAGIGLDDDDVVGVNFLFQARIEDVVVAKLTLIEGIIGEKTGVR